MNTPDHVITWVRDHAESNSFARSLSQDLNQYGNLTPRQSAAVLRSLTLTLETGAGFAPILEAFQAARLSGLKHPKVTVDTLRFSLAGDTSANPGFIYVKDSGTYSGKISPLGVFSPARECTSFTVDRIREICADPLAAMVRHGRLTGHCAVCSLPLSDPESLARGIGPICAKRYGW